MCSAAKCENVCSNKDGDAEKNYGEFAKLYARDEKSVNVQGNGNMWFLYGFPTLRDVVMGLY